VGCIFVFRGHLNEALIGGGSRHLVGGDAQVNALLLQQRIHHVDARQDELFFFNAPHRLVSNG